MKGRIFAVMIAMLFGFTGIEHATAADESANSATTAFHKDKGHRGKQHVRKHHRHSSVQKAHGKHHHHVRHHKAKKAHRHHAHKSRGVRHHNHR